MPTPSVKGFTWYPLLEGTCLYGDFVPRRLSKGSAISPPPPPSITVTAVLDQPANDGSLVRPVQILNGKIKLAIFDVDKTVIAPRDGGRFPKDADDWEWVSTGVPAAIQAAYADG